MAIAAAAVIRAPVDEVWRLTQDPARHVRWDLRFSRIEAQPGDSAASQWFSYVTNLGFGIAVAEWGETLGAPDRATSALRFGSEDPRALITAGMGSWTYRPAPEGTAFSTVFDYSVRYGLAGRIVDRLLFRPLMAWAVRWSFDRLRLWIETGTPPELLWRLWAIKVGGRSAIGMIWALEGVVPKLLAPTAAEVALVGRLVPPGFDPPEVLTALGVTQTVFGFWLVSGMHERLTAPLSAAGVLLATILVSLVAPEAWLDFYGGIVKNLSFLACSLAVWALAPVVPRARRESRG